MNCKIALSLILMLSASMSANAQIDVSYDQAMRYLAPSFNMEASSPVDGVERSTGLSDDKLALIELVGKRSNLIQASLMIVVPNDSAGAVAQNSGRLLRFVANTVPEWKGNASWIKSGLRKIAKGDYSDSTTTIGSKTVKMQSLKEGAMILTTITKS